MNPRCNVPFHITLTDTVITHGGSTELCTILNRIGVAASVEAHKKLMDSVVEKREKNGMENELVKNALNIVSIDNIDLRQPGAQVYHSVQHRSWHGTTVQCVQPRPTSHPTPRKRPLQDCLHSFQRVTSLPQRRPLQDCFHSFQRVTSLTRRHPLQGCPAASLPLFPLFQTKISIHLPKLHRFHLSSLCSS